MQEQQKQLEQMKMNPGMFDVTRDEDEAEVEDQNNQDLLLTLQEDHV